MTDQEMLKMRIDGASFQEIADACGMTKQGVHKRLVQYAKKVTMGIRGKSFCLNDIKFAAIKVHFAYNDDETTTTFAQKVGVSPGIIRNFIKGKTESYFTVSQIKKMCDVVGKPFEEVFKECWE